MKHSKLILCITFLLISVCLSGCNETNNNNGNQQQNTNNTDTKFIGDWEMFISSSDYKIWSFYTNKTAKNIVTENDEGQSITTTLWYNYTIENTIICFSTINEPLGSPNYISLCFSYSFSDNSTHLVLSSINSVIFDLEKIT
jgi:hypothetical protein